MFSVSLYVQMILALLPSCVIMFLVLRNAKYKKEPVKKILQVFGISVLSVVPAMIAEAIGMVILCACFAGQVSYYGYGYSGVSDGTYLLFYLLEYIFVVGLSEELCKFFTFRWIIFSDRQFDNTYDGIIYGAASALGFASLENILYIFFSNEPLKTALLRAVLSIPMHAITGIFMGYYFGIAKYRRYNNIDPKSNPQIPALIFSILLHGVYDFVATLPAIYSDNNTVVVMSYVLLAVIMIGIYVLMGITINRAKREKHNIYNRYYYEQLDGAFQDMYGEKTKPQKMLFGVPIFYYHQNGVFNPYNPYMNMNIPPRQYGVNANPQYNPNGMYSGVQPSQYAQSVPVQMLPDVKYCPVCGEQAQADAKFCRNCGTQLM